jgi:putative ABC transport system substrate-binding protein
MAEKVEARRPAAGAGRGAGCGPAGARARCRTRRSLAGLAVAVALVPRAVRSQPTGKVPRIGYLSPGPAGGSPRDQAFRQGLRELGHVEGSTLLVEYRFAEGRFERLPELAAELVLLEVEVIVGAVTQASLAARAATTRIPVVMAGVSDPVGAGLVASLARPGGNVTGTSGMNAELAGKALELFLEALPGLAEIAVLWNPGNAVFQGEMLRRTRAAARTLGVGLRPLEARDAGELDRAFASLAGERVGGVLVLADPVFVAQRSRIVELAARARLPAMYGSRDFVEAGGLLSYGPDLDAQFRRAAAFVDRILKGARPEDLPVEQPTRLELAVNLATARALGLTLPPALLARADATIE